MYVDILLQVSILQWIILIAPMDDVSQQTSSDLEYKWMMQVIILKSSIFIAPMGDVSQHTSGFQ